MNLSISQSAVNGLVQVISLLAFSSDRRIGLWQATTAGPAEQWRQSSTPRAGSNATTMDVPHQSFDCMRRHDTIPVAHATAARGRRGNRAKEALAYGQAE